jgi:hypothetical protein
MRRQLDTQLAHATDAERTTHGANMRDVLIHKDSDVWAPQKRGFTHSFTPSSTSSYTRRPESTSHNCATAAHSSTLRGILDQHNDMHTSNKVHNAGRSVSAMGWHDVCAGADTQQSDLLFASMFPRLDHESCCDAGRQASGQNWNPDSDNDATNATIDGVAYMPLRRQTSGQSTRQNSKEESTQDQNNMGYLGYEPPGGHDMVQVAIATNQYFTANVEHVHDSNGTVPRQSSSEDERGEHASPSPESQGNRCTRIDKLTFAQRFFMLQEKLSSFSDSDTGRHTSLGTRPGDFKLRRWR